MTFGDLEVPFNVTQGRLQKQAEILIWNKLILVFDTRRRRTSCCCALRTKRAERLSRVGPSARNELPAHLRMRAVTDSTVFTILAETN